MNSEEPPQLISNPTPSDYLKKHSQLKEGFISIEEWEEYSKNVLILFSHQFNRFPLRFKVDSRF